MAKKEEKENSFLSVVNAGKTKVKSKEKIDKATEKDKIKKSEILQTAKKNSVDDIVKKTGDVKLQTMKAFDTLEAQLTLEFQKLQDLSIAISDQENLIEDLYQIKAEADTLASLLQAQEDQRNAFEEERNRIAEEFNAAMKQKQEDWQKEQRVYQLSIKEDKERVNKERIREDEEYEYEKKLARKQDQDEYNERKKNLERDLALLKERVESQLNAREKEIADKEKEFNDLKAQVESFNAKLDSEVKKAEAITKNSIEREYKHKIELMEMSFNSESKVKDQNIVQLQNKVAEQDIVIKELNDKLSKAIGQVQQIAEKAIEGASKPKEIFYKETQNSK